MVQRATSLGPKPSKKNNNKKTTTKNKQKTEKKGETNKKKQKYSKMELFSFQSKCSCFWVGDQNCLFSQLGPKSAHPEKHYKIGVSAKKNICVTKRPFLDPQNPNPEIPVIIFFLCSPLSTTKNTNICWNPYFNCVLANLKKENFQNLNLMKNPIFAPFFEKAIFRKMPDNWTQTKNIKIINWVCNKIAWNHYKDRLKTNLDQIITPTWTR